jgi:ribonuclease Z
MRPAFHPYLVNDPFGDPSLFVDFLFERRALLFDLGDIHALPSRKLLRVSDIFVSLCHRDHLMGFDWFLRICLGREQNGHLYGPPGFLDQVRAKLRCYTWNLVYRYENDFFITATELAGNGAARQAVFRVRHAFRREEEALITLDDLILLGAPGFRVHYTFLVHHTPCLAFALEEKQHVNVWKNYLAEWGLLVGSWLQGLKRAVLEGLAPDSQIAGPEGKRMPCLRLTPGIKFAYVTDVVYHERNAESTETLARGVDKFFIEVQFTQELAARAKERYHLTAVQAGRLAHRVGVKSVVPFHHSLIYQGQEAQLQAELEAHYRLGIPPPQNA